MEREQPTSGILPQGRLVEQDGLLGVVTDVTQKWSGIEYRVLFLSGDSRWIPEADIRPIDRTPTGE